MNPPAAQQLATMDIFSLLGIENASDEEREMFLNQLQDASWEEVVEDELLAELTEEEVNSIEQTVNDENMSADDKRNALFSMLSDKVPNLEERLADSTNQLKFDLLGERVDGLREYYKDKPDQLSVLDQVEQMVESGNVTEAVNMLNKQQAENTSA